MLNIYHWDKKDVSSLFVCVRQWCYDTGGNDAYEVYKIYAYSDEITDMCRPIHINTLFHSLTHTHTHSNICFVSYIYICVCRYVVCMYVCMLYALMYVCCMYLCVYVVCVYVVCRLMHVCIYVCMYVIKSSNFVSRIPYHIIAQDSSDETVCTIKRLEFCRNILYCASIVSGLLEFCNSFITEHIQYCISAIWGCISVFGSISDCTSIVSIPISFKFPLILVHFLLHFHCTQDHLNFLLHFHQIEVKIRCICNNIFVIDCCTSIKSAPFNWYIYSISLSISR